MCAPMCICPTMYMREIVQTCVCLYMVQGMAEHVISGCINVYKYLAYDRRLG